MRLHEAAPKLIIQERVGDKVKVSSYWPVPELTRAELALGRLHRLMGCPNERINGWNNIFASSLLANQKTGPLGSRSPLPFTTTEGIPPQVYRLIRSSSDTKPPSFRRPSSKQTTRPLYSELNEWRKAEPRPSKQSTELGTVQPSHLPNSRSTTRYG